MKHHLVSLFAAMVVAALLVAGCSPAAPAPTAAPAAPAKTAEPAKATAAPAATKPAEPTKPAAAPAPTAAPAAKIDYPVKGKTMTVIVPFAAGGPVDLVARSLAPGLEKELGVQVQIVNKAGASTIVGLTEVAKAKPDGYTIGWMTSSSPAAYLDPEAKATIGRKDFEPIVNVESHSSIMAVAANGPYKSLKDVIDAAKAKPRGVKFSASGQLTVGSIFAFSLQQLAGIQFAMVYFDSGAESMAAVLGGHADVNILNPNVAVAQVKAGSMLSIGSTGRERNKFLPDVPTVKEQGYDVSSYSTMGIVAPAGTPKEIVNLVAGAVKKTIDDPAVKKMMDENYNEIRYMDPAQFSAEWEIMEVEARKGVAAVRGTAK